MTILRNSFMKANTKLLLSAKLQMKILAFQEVLERQRWIVKWAWIKQLYLYIYLLVMAAKYEVVFISCVMRKPAFCICENKGADQLCSNSAFVFPKKIAIQYNHSTS